MKQSPINLNTLFLTVILALSGWTVKKVSEQGESVAAISQQVRNLERIVFSQQFDRNAQQPTGRQQ